MEKNKKKGKKQVCRAVVDAKLRRLGGVVWIVGRRVVEINKYF